VASSSEDHLLEKVDAFLPDHVFGDTDLRHLDAWPHPTPT